MRKTIFLLLVLVVVIIGLLHFFTPAHLLFYHDTYRRLSYFPIAIGGLLYGLRGGLSLAVLSSIKGTAEILLDEFPKEYPKREFVDILSSEISRLQTAVEEALQFSRTRRSQEEGQDIELASATMERVIRLLKNSPQGKSVDFQIETSPENQACLVDGDKLFQVFLNVLLNAVDAVPKKQGRVEITITQEQGDCTIVISDNGPGIGPSEREKIFTPFYTNKQDGTGLGLAISQKIVQSYGGSMTVGSSRTGGASFRIHLPKNEAGPDPIQGDYRQSFDLSR